MTSPPSKPRKRSRYHHGDLPRALVEAALALVEERGASALTLRQVARRVEVTHAAPYRHFKDKSALLAAVAEEGFRRLVQVLAKARGAVPASARRAAMGVAYLRFAIEHPAHYRLMFGAAAEDNGSPGLQTAAAELRTELQRAMGPAGRAAEGATATTLWAEWHGLALLHLGGWLDQPAVSPKPPLLARALAAVRRPDRDGAPGLATKPAAGAADRDAQPAESAAGRGPADPSAAPPSEPAAGGRQTSSGS